MLIFDDGRMLDVRTLSKNVRVKGDTLTYLEIFAHSFLRNPTSGCCEWIGRIDREGRGAFEVEGEVYDAKTLSYLLSTGAELPPYSTVESVCRNHSCVNPEHLSFRPRRVVNSPSALQELRAHDAEKVQDMASKGASATTLAAMFGTSEKEIRSVLNGQQWHVLYTDGVMRTASTRDTMRDQIEHCLIGMSAEVGEVANLMRKTLFAGHPLDTAKVKDELGDVLFYYAWFCHLMDLDMAAIAERNKEKLKARFPAKFSTAASLNRDEAKE